MPVREKDHNIAKGKKECFLLFFYWAEYEQIN